VVRLFDQKMTLDHLEHGMLRKDYEEPLRRGSFKVKYTHYDWALNDLESEHSEKKR